MTRTKKGRGLAHRVNNPLANQDEEDEQLDSNLEVAADGKYPVVEKVRTNLLPQVFIIHN